MESRLNKMTRPKKVQKRDGSLVPFAGEKIQNAIAKAAGEVLQDSISARAIASKLTATVIQKLFAQYKGQTLHMEAIQDAVETVLMEEGYSRQKLYPLPGKTKRHSHGQVGFGDQR